MAALLIAGAAILGHWGAVTAVAAADNQALVPLPKSFQAGDGAMPLTAQTRIVAADPALQPLAVVLADELELLTGLRLSPNNVAQPPEKGDIVLRINAQLRADDDMVTVRKEGESAVLVRTRDHAHTIAVTDTAVVEGSDYRAVCAGTATLLQAIVKGEAGHAVPRMTVKDWPSCDYTATMVDVARQQIPIDALKAVVEACRFWKIRYCHLHLTDDEGFTFPSTAFPKLGTKNQSMHGGVVPRVYAIEELRDLVAFADARGVTLVPELATPGHFGAMGRAMPELFGGPKIMNMTNDDMYTALDTLVGEMCDVFKTSPYFHIGCEELYFYELDEMQHTKDYLQQKSMKNIDDLFVRHVERMTDMVQRRGRMALAWENAALPVEGRAYVLPERIRSRLVPMCWIPYPTAEALQKQGYATITVPWERGDSLFRWNAYLCNGVTLDPAKDKVLGSAVTMWQMSAPAVVGDFLGGQLNGSSAEGYVRSLGDFTQGAWSPAVAIDPAVRKAAAEASRARLDALLFPVRIEGKAIAYRGWPVVGCQYFSGAVEVGISALPGAGGEIRYTIDGSEPTLQSAVYSKPLSLEESATVHAVLMRNGKQVGAVSRAKFERLEDDGAITKWLAAGPYTADGKTALDLFDQSFDPETSGNAEWKPVSAATVKFGDLPGFAGTERVAYMKTQVFSPLEQKAKLLVASDDGVKVYLNGKVVHTANLLRAAFTPDTIDVTLKEGWNQLLLKVTNGAEGWEAWVKVRSADGGRLEKIRVRPE